MADFFNSEKCKPGDVWQLGPHRLMVGDSCNPADVDRLMDGEKADMVINDPPYGMRMEGKGVFGDNQSYDDLLDFARRWVPLSFSVMKGNGAWYCFGSDKSIMDIYAFILRPMIQKKEITFKSLLTWDKMSGRGQMSKYQRTYAAADEKCLFVVGGLDFLGNNAVDYWPGFDEIRLYLAGEKKKLPKGLKMPDILGNKMGRHFLGKSQWVFPSEENYKKLQEAGKPYGAFAVPFDELKEKYDEALGIKQADDAGKRAAKLSYFDNTAENINTVWHIAPASPKERKYCGGFYAVKPQKVMERAIRCSSREGETVLDMFGGSGSTLIACETLGRKCRMMENSPHWAGVIINRWEKETGGQCTLLEAREALGRM